MENSMTPTQTTAKGSGIELTAAQMRDLLTQNDGLCRILAAVDSRKASLDDALVIIDQHFHGVSEDW